MFWKLFFRVDSVFLFNSTKMKKVTIDKLWKHLDDDGSGVIERGEIKGCLDLASKLCVAYRFTEQGMKGKPKIDTKEISRIMKPVSKWILAEKMKNENDVIKKDELRSKLGQWLLEYPS